MDLPTADKEQSAAFIVSVYPLLCLLCFALAFLLVLFDGSFFPTRGFACFAPFVIRGFAFRVTLPCSAATFVMQADRREGRTKVFGVRVSRVSKSTSVPWYPGHDAVRLLVLPCILHFGSLATEAFYLGPHGRYGSYTSLR